MTEKDLDNLDLSENSSEGGSRVLDLQEKQKQELLSTLSINTLLNLDEVVVKRAYLVRHGYTTACDYAGNKKKDPMAGLTDHDYFSTKHDKVISGKQQMEDVGNKLKLIGLNNKNTKLWCAANTMRIKESSEIIGDKIGLQKDMMNEDLLKLDSIPEYKQEDEMLAKLEGGAMNKEFYESQMLPYLEDKNESKNLVLVLHKSSTSNLENMFKRQQMEFKTIYDHKYGEIREWDFSKSGSFINKNSRRDLLQLTSYNFNSIVSSFDEKSELSETVKKLQNIGAEIWEIQNYINAYFRKNPELYKVNFLSKNYDLRIYCIINLIKNNKEKFVLDNFTNLLLMENENSVFEFLGIIFENIHKDQKNELLKVIKNSEIIGNKITELLEESSLYYWYYYNSVIGNIEHYLKNRTFDNKLQNETNWFDYLQFLGFEEDGFNNIESLLSQDKTIFIQKEAGGGKSMKLIEILWYLRPENQLRKNNIDNIVRVPIYINLNNNELDDVKEIHKKICEDIGKLLGKSLKIEYVYLFDGLDESYLNNEGKIKLFHYFNKQLNKKGKIIIVGRPGCLPEYDNYKDVDIILLNLHHFNDEQIVQYIEDHLGSNYNENLLKCWKEKEFFKELATNPLMLSFVVELLLNDSLAKKLNELSDINLEEIDNRVKLYEAIVFLRLLIWENNKSNREAGLSKLRKRILFLNEIAYTSLVRGENISSSLLNEVSDNDNFEGIIPNINNTKLIDYECLNLLIKNNFFPNKYFNSYFDMLSGIDQKDDLSISLGLNLNGLKSEESFGKDLEEGFSTLTESVEKERLLHSDSEEDDNIEGKDDSLYADLKKALKKLHDLGDSRAAEEHIRNHNLENTITASELIVEKKKLICDIKNKNYKYEFVLETIREYFVANHIIEKINNNNILNDYRLTDQFNKFDYWILESIKIGLTNSGINNFIRFVFDDFSKKYLKINNGIMVLIGLIDKDLLEKYLSEKYLRKFSVNSITIDFLFKMGYTELSKKYSKNNKSEVRNSIVKNLIQIEGDSCINYLLNEFKNEKDEEIQNIIIAYILQNGNQVEKDKTRKIFMNSIYRNIVLLLINSVDIPLRKDYMKEVLLINESIEVILLILEESKKIGDYENINYLVDSIKNKNGVINKGCYLEKAKIISKLWFLFKTESKRSIQKILENFKSTKNSEKCLDNVLKECYDLDLFDMLVRILGEIGRIELIGAMLKNCIEISSFGNYDRYKEGFFHVKTRSSKKKLLNSGLDRELFGGLTRSEFVDEGLYSQLDRHIISTGVICKILKNYLEKFDNKDLYEKFNKIIKKEFGINSLIDKENNEMQLKYIYICSILMGVYRFTSESIEKLEGILPWIDLYDAKSSSEFFLDINKIVEINPHILNILNIRYDNKLSIKSTVILLKNKMSGLIRKKKKKKLIDILIESVNNIPLLYQLFEGERDISVLVYLIVSLENADFKVNGKFIKILESKIFQELSYEKKSQEIRKLKEQWGDNDNIFKI